MIRFFLLKFATKFISSIQYSVGLSHITIMRKNYKKNNLSYLSGDEKINTIRNCKVVDLSSSKKKIVKLSKLI